MTRNHYLYLICFALCSYVPFCCAKGAQVSSQALILIEYQNEWVAEDGFLRTHLVKDQLGFSKAIKQSSRLLQLARSHDINVIHVTLMPDENYNIFGSALYGLRAAIPKANTWKGKMKDIHPTFAPLSHEHVITERTGASGFAGSNLDNYLRNNGINTIFIAGFATHVCVESTLREAHDKGYNTYVVTDATAAFTQAQQNYFESEVLHHFGYGIKVDELTSTIEAKTN